MIDCKTEISQGRRFAFGQNWLRFGQLIDEERVARARRSLETALSTTDLTGRTFLDIGCGSGLFSLAAQRMGAQVRSFDYDPDSVNAAEKVRQEFAPHSDWSICRGSILDSAFVQQLDQADIVYSWGSCTTQVPCGRRWRRPAAWWPRAGRCTCRSTTTREPRAGSGRR